MIFNTLGKILFKVLSMSVSGAFIICAVILFRLFFGNNHRKFCLILWVLVAVKLSCPVSLQVSSVFSDSPIAKDMVFLNPQSWFSHENSIYDAFQKQPDTSLTFPKQDNVSVIPEETRTELSFFSICSMVWAAGILIIAVYCLINTFQLRRLVRIAVLQPEGYYFCDYIHDAFILGVFRPEIYIPSSMDPENCRYAFLHEQEHIRHKDPVWKALAFLILSVHWFNPFVIIAYILFGQDLEYLCDEAVTSQFSLSEKGSYAKVLIAAGNIHRDSLIQPLSLGSRIYKKRITNILKARKRTVVGSMSAVLSVFFIAACTLMNPSNTDSTMINPTEAESKVISSAYFMPISAGFHPMEAIIVINKTDLIDSYLFETDAGYLYTNSDKHVSNSQRVEGSFLNDVNSTDIYWTYRGTVDSADYASSVTITARFYQESHLTGYGIIRLTHVESDTYIDGDGKTSSSREYSVEVIKCVEFPKINGEYQIVSDTDLERIIGGNTQKK